MSRWPLLIFRSVDQRSRSKVMPILYMLGKGGISVLQTFIFFLGFGGNAFRQIVCFPVGTSYGLSYPTYFCTHRKRYSLSLLSARKKQLLGPPSHIDKGMAYFPTTFCKVDRPFWSRGSAPSRKQKFYSPSCILSRARCDTSDRNNSQSVIINGKYTIPLSLCEGEPRSLFFFYQTLWSSFLPNVTWQCGRIFSFKFSGSPRGLKGVQ